MALSLMKGVICNGNLCFSGWTVGCRLCRWRSTARWTRGWTASGWRRPAPTSTPPRAPTPYGTRPSRRPTLILWGKLIKGSLAPINLVNQIKIKRNMCVCCNVVVFIRRQVYGSWKSLSASILGFRHLCPSDLCKLWRLSVLNYGLSNRGSCVRTPPRTWSVWRALGEAYVSAVEIVLADIMMINKHWNWRN